MHDGTADLGAARAANNGRSTNFMPHLSCMRMPHNRYALPHDFFPVVMDMDYNRVRRYNGHGIDHNGRLGSDDPWRRACDTAKGRSEHKCARPSVLRNTQGGLGPHMHTVYMERRSVLVRVGEGCAIHRLPTRWHRVCGRDIHVAFLRDENVDLGRLTALDLGELPTVEHRRDILPNVFAIRERDVPIAYRSDLETASGYRQSHRVLGRLRVREPEG